MIKEAIELVIDIEGFRIVIEPKNNRTFFMCLPSHIGPILALILKQKRIDNGLTIRDVAHRLGQTSPI